MDGGPSPTMTIRGRSAALAEPVISKRRLTFDLIEAA
jgi:hypothetical protein